MLRGHHGDVYVWVCAWGVPGLTDFTLSVLQMATALHPPQVLDIGSAGVAYSPGFDTSF